MDKKILQSVKGHSKFHFDASHHPQGHTRGPDMIMLGDPNEYHFTNHINSSASSGNLINPAVQGTPQQFFTSYIRYDKGSHRVRRPNFKPL